MSYDQIKLLTLDQAQRELAGPKSKPRLVIEDERVKAQRTMLETICYRNRLTPAQLAAMQPIEVLAMLKDVDSRLEFELLAMRQIVDRFAAESRRKAKA